MTSAVERSLKRISMEDLGGAEGGDRQRLGDDGGRQDAPLLFVTWYGVAILMMAALARQAGPEAAAVVIGQLPPRLMMHPD